MTVYVVQEQHRWDAQKQQLVPRFDLSSAEDYGDLDYLLSPTAAPFSGESIVDDLHAKLRHFDCTEDYLLLIGNPCLIGWSVAIADFFSEGPVKLLQWSGKDRRYIVVEADLQLPPLD